jgi:cytochrome-b5 reductase
MRPRCGKSWFCWEVVFVRVRQANCFRAQVAAASAFACLQMQMIRSRSRHLLRARLLSTSASTGAPAQSPRRLRHSAIVFLASTGVLVSSYFFWPSQYRGCPTFSHEPLSPKHFIPVTVSENSHAGPDLAVLTLSIPSDAHASSSSFDPIWSIFIKDDDIQVERPYTPLFGIDEKGTIKLWVKRYSRGEVGRWLHSKRAGDTIEIRGPLQTFPFREGKWDEVVMVCAPPPPLPLPTVLMLFPPLNKISGGTGFSPFHQLMFRHLLRGDLAAGGTRFTLLHASRSPEELPPSPCLQPLIDLAAARPERLRLRLFVDGASGASAPESVAKHLKVGRIDKSSIAHTLGLSDGAWTWTSWFANVWSGERDGDGDGDIRKKNVLVLVCGPERYVLLDSARHTDRLIRYRFYATGWWPPSLALTVKITRRGRSAVCWPSWVSRPGRFGSSDAFHRIETRCSWHVASAIQPHSREDRCALA